MIKLSKQTFRRALFVNANKGALTNSYSIFMCVAFSIKKNKSVFKIRTPYKNSSQGFTML